MAAYILSGFPVRCPLSAQWRHITRSPLPSAHACPKKKMKGASRKFQKRDRGIEKKRTTDAVPTSYSSSADAMKEGVGRSSGSSPRSFRYRRGGRIAGRCGTYWQMGVAAGRC